MTALIQVKNIALSKGTRSLFENLSLNINKGSRIGLVGHNGSGKTSLMALLAGQSEADQGEIVKRRGLSVAWVEQFVSQRILNSPLLDCVVEVLPEEEQETRCYQAETLLAALGFIPYQLSQTIQTLSGGQQNLALLARAQIQAPDVLLLDEPGNHMDIAALGGLKSFLNRMRGITFVMISHDRTLLDECCETTVFLRDKRSYSFSLPYSEAASALRKQDDDAFARRQSEQNEIDRISASAKRLAHWGRTYDNEDLARKAKTMQARAEKLEANQTQVTRGSGLHLQLQTQGLRSNSVVTLENLVVTAPDDARPLAKCEFLVIRPGERVGLLGKNGSGKSTSIRQILKALREYDPSIRFNPNTSLGYFDQELEGFTEPLSRFDWLSQHSRQPDDVVKRALIGAGIAYVDFSQTVDTLSGGEKARLVFMLLALQKPNFLVLDEPTNHIDLESREQLEVQLSESGSSMLVTSHDRRFLDNVCTRYWEIDQGLLRETQNPQSYYDSFDTTRDSNVKKESSLGLASGQNRGISSEEDLLSRIQELEDLLAADRNRKAKFQKPGLQEQWQSELNLLWAKLDG